MCLFSFFFSSRRRHTRSKRDWSSDVCSSDLIFGTIWIESFLALDDRLLVKSPLPCLLQHSTRMKNFLPPYKAFLFVITPSFLSLPYPFHLLTYCLKPPTH